ncbi:hypothetical protein JL100_007485 [Skermanella mucosa]|uniref:hypothetical protein n=1 Tax=Skermanella mucosa TaxID=1789672 RepID=UPI00192C1282|nr:hypothetical protein [Skermanella mucosa]UEM22582.1 hypothetical protein JL100_007485 [Skermanella mucosa]
MRYREQNEDGNDTAGHIGAAAGLIIGIVLGSVMLNFTGSEISGEAGSNSAFTRELKTLMHG